MLEKLKFSIISLFKVFNIKHRVCKGKVFKLEYNVNNIVHFKLHKETKELLSLFKFRSL